MLERREVTSNMAKSVQAKLLICFQLQGDLEPWPPWQAGVQWNSFPFPSSKCAAGLWEGCVFTEWQDQMLLLLIDMGICYTEHF